MWTKKLDRRDAEEIVSLLRSAILQIEMDRPECAGWRVADAGLFLRHALQDFDSELIGVHRPTGQGAILPSRDYADKLGQ